MLKDLLKVANKLDALGLTKEADVVDSLINKMAGKWSHKGMGMGEDAPIMNFEETPARTSFRDSDIDFDSNSDVIPEEVAVSEETPMPTYNFADFDWNLDPADWSEEQWGVWDVISAKVNKDFGHDKKASSSEPSYYSEDEAIAMIDEKEKLARAIDNMSDEDFTKLRLMFPQQMEAILASTKNQRKDSDQIHKMKLLQRSNVRKHFK